MACLCHTQDKRARRFARPLFETHTDHPATCCLATELRRLVEVVSEFPAAKWLAQLAQSLGFDLPDTLACEPETAAYLIERIGMAITQAIAHLQHTVLTWAKSGEQL